MSYSKLVGFASAYNINNGRIFEIKVEVWENTDSASPLAYQVRRYEGHHGELTLIYNRDFFGKFDAMRYALDYLSIYIDAGWRKELSALELLAAQGEHFEAPST